MKKFIYLMFSLILVLTCFVFSGCNKKPYTVSYYSEGKLVQTINASVGDKIKNISVNSSNGYDFIGWAYNGDYLDKDMLVNSDIRLDALFGGYDVNIVFKNSNGVILNKNDTLYTAGEYIIAPKDPEISSDSDYDYIFSGWDKEFKIAQSDMEIVATYSTKTRQYKVTYYSYDNKTVFLTNMVDKGMNAPNPVLDRNSDQMYDYEFNAWYTEDGNIYDFNSPITKNIYLYPSFKTKPIPGFDLSKAVVSMLGDSVSTYYSASSNVNSYYSGHNEFYYPIYSGSVLKAEQTWWYQAIDMLGAKLGINNSLSGSCVYGGDTATQSDKRINTLNENGEPNIIFCMISANDNVNGFTVNQVKSAYNTMLTKLHEKYPNAYVFCITWGYVGYTGYNYTEERRLEFNQAIRDLCELDYATVIDWANIQTEDTYKDWLGDAMHFNTLGMTKLAEYVNKCVRDYFGCIE